MKPSNALELELGIGRADNQLYNVTKEEYPHNYGRKDVGKISLYHKFQVTKVIGIKIWVDHYSQLSVEEPNFNSNGKNMAGGSLTFKIF